MTPGIIAVSISAIPIAVALILFWQICTEIGRDNSFCHKNASRLTGIGFCALVDTGYCAVGTVTLEIMVGSPIWVTGLMVCTVGLSIALAAFLLSHLVLRLAVQGPANSLQGGEAHRLSLVGLQDGQVGDGHVHLLGELAEGARRRGGINEKDAQGSFYLELFGSGEGG